MKDLEKKDKLIHRDLSWLSFNERVLEESTDLSNPLLERVKFLAIFVSNLDEFFMVRVAGLKDVIGSEINKVDQYGYYAQDVLRDIKTRTQELIKRLYQIYQGSIYPELEKNEITLKKYDALKKEQKKFVQNYFESILYPIVTPLAVDPGHPFPVLPSKTIAFAVHVLQKKESFLAIIPIPKNTPRLIKLPSSKTESSFILVDEVLRQHLKNFFKGYQVKSAALFRVIRNSELTLDEEMAPDLLKSIEDEIKKRRRAEAVYLEIETSCEQALKEKLCEGLRFPVDDVIQIESNLDFNFFFEMLDKVERPDLRYPGYLPGKIEYEKIFERISAGDFITHLPYQSFYPTVNLISSAAKDEHVLAIKMTLYRTSKDSAIIEALKEAARNRKQVTVLVEIKARFDEENNIRWVRELEDAGCHVIYGMPGLKVHSKMALIVRKEEGQIKRYVHLSTGNYNEKTARVYTDIGYFTANEDFAKDISDVFNVVTGYSVPATWKRIISAPNDLRDYFFSLVDREIKFHKKGKNGLIQAKFNSLEDPRMIDKLYEASQTGVKIQLIVRGICCLIPGVKDLSENITVKSLVGRFLEHSRIYIFNNNNAPRVFLSSADWMTRNFDRRVELLFEITKEEIKGQLKDVIGLCWKDNVKSRMLMSDRSYQRWPADGEKFNFQEHLISHNGR